MGKLKVFLFILIACLVSGLLYKYLDLEFLVILWTAIGSIAIIMVFLGVIGVVLSIFGFFAPTKHVGSGHASDGTRVDVYTYESDEERAETRSFSTSIFIWGVVIFAAYFFDFIILSQIGVNFLL